MGDGAPARRVESRPGVGYNPEVRNAARRRPLDEAERKRWLDLLESTHEFPGEYPLTVIIQNDSTILTAVRAAIDVGLPQPLSDAALEIVSSRAARYLSLRFMVRLPDAHAVLDLHARVHKVPGVVRIL